MKIFNTHLVLLILSTVLSGQVLWNDPPEYTTYAGRNIVVILPPPQNFTASVTINNQVLLHWDEYWTVNFLIAYQNRMGYPPIPNRFSLYKKNVTDSGIVNALTGVSKDENQYVDTNVILGKEYMYQIMASDLNYLNPGGGWQRWSKKSDATAYITIGQILPPNNFTGYYEPNFAAIILNWDYVKDATSYTIYKSYKNPENYNQWEHLTIPVGNVDKYNDYALLEYVDYVYTLIAVIDNFQSVRTSPLLINSGTLGIENEKYWEEVKEYEKDQKVGWFGCSFNK